MKLAPIVISITCLVLTAGCANTGAPYGERRSAVGEEQIRSGTITRIDPVSLEHPHQSGLGAVLGAAAGGVVGNQFGRGHGRDVATVVGLIGGGIIGNQQEAKYADVRPGQHIFVQLNNGVTVAVTQPSDANLRVGDAVTVQGGGQSARVVRR